jgi:8-oxo-dGTP diphosphatase
VPPGALHVVGAVLLRGGRCLVARRRPGGSAGGRWEFPGGKVEEGETPELALERELGEELGVSARIGTFAGRGQASRPGRTIALDVYFAELVFGEPVAHDHEELRWVSAAELDELAWAEADVPVLPAVRAALLALERR